MPLLRQSGAVDERKSYEQGLDEDLIDSIIYHPAIPKIYAIAEESNKDIPPPEFLTEQEKRRLRRKRNEDKQKQKQEMVTLGLAPPPEDRCRIFVFVRCSF